MEIRRSFRRILGNLPRIPGRPRRILGRRFCLEGIQFERWSIAGATDEIHAWFLLPERLEPPAAAVLAIHPHGRQYEVGKSLVAGLVGDQTRSYGLAAAKAGFAVLAPDMPGFEDSRPPLRARKRNYSLQGEHYERSLALHALVQGGTLQGRILVDISACISALRDDGRVAMDRIGCMGQSFGGQETVFAMLFDRRIRAGIVSCGFSLVRLLVDRWLSHNMALYVPRMLPKHDFDSLVSALAPRPLFVISGTRDEIFPIDGVRIVEKAARAAYHRAHADKHLRFEYFDGPHDLPPRLLESSLSWLRRTLA